MPNFQNKDDGSLWAYEKDKGDQGNSVADFQHESARPTKNELATGISILTIVASAMLGSVDTHPVEATTHQIESQTPVALTHQVDTQRNLEQRGGTYNFGTEVEVYDVKIQVRSTIWGYILNVTRKSPDGGSITSTTGERGGRTTRSGIYRRVTWGVQTAYGNLTVTADGRTKTFSVN